ncbi:MAG TPA: hypothetical protein VMR52_08455 [Dehalococcoidia bacterium]|nr:hypothetical protein [Dehalococcoidia bacterium]
MRRFLPLLLLLIIPLAAVAYIVVSNSGDDDDASGSGGPTPNPVGNLLSDPGFEESDGPCTTEEGAATPCWYSLREPVWQSSDERAHTGEKAALLHMRDTAESEETKIYYLVQEFGLDPTQPLPEVISGNYLVENWESGTYNQYLQFVVILWGDDFSNLPVCPSQNPCPNYQIRYLLAGIDQDPFAIANAKFAYVGTEDPVEGEWVHFERNLHEDFQSYWGAVPHSVTRIRLLYEVRYDDKLPGEGPMEADVYYDDLYLGDAETAP